MSTENRTSIVQNML